MGNFEYVILAGALAYAAYLACVTRGEYPMNVIRAAGVLTTGTAIVLWRLYVDVPWYWDLLAGAVPVALMVSWSAWLMYRMAMIASSDTALARNNLIASEGCAGALAAYDEEDFEGCKSRLIELGKQGNRDAQYNLGVLYEIGVGGERDDRLAEIWYRKAAENGLPQAQFSLATALAADFMEQSADHGYRPDVGGTTLAERERRFVEAYRWLLAAKQAKHNAASTGLKRLGKNMTKAQVAAARQMFEDEGAKAV